MQISYFKVHSITVQIYAILYMIISEEQIFTNWQNLQKLLLFKNIVTITFYLFGRYL